MSEQEIKWPPYVYFSSADIHPTFKEWLAQEMLAAMDGHLDEGVNLQFYKGMFTFSIQPAKEGAPPKEVTGDFNDLMEAWCDSVRCDPANLVKNIDMYKNEEPGSYKWLKGIISMRVLDGTITRTKPL